jgi:hypothetical protein
MNHSEKQFLTRTSPLVVQHVKELLEPFQELPEGSHSIHPKPMDGMTDRKTQMFWRYQGHYKMEFVLAITETLPMGYKFVNYDHFKNELNVEVVAV